MIDPVGYGVITANDMRHGAPVCLGPDVIRLGKRAARQNFALVKQFTAFG